MRQKILFLLSVAAFLSLSESGTTSVTIHIIGDSTVCNYAASAYPQTGWGQELGAFFDSSKVKINNVAIGGRSSKTFYTDGRLASLKSSVKSGDFIFIQFGHNDRYFGTNARQVPLDSFAYFLQIYVDSAKKWGATPVFVSPMVMNAWKGTTLRNVFVEQDYRGAMKTLAAKDGIPFLDLNMKSWNQYSGYGQAYITRFLFKSLLAGEYPNYPDGVNDGATHFQEAGSVGHAGMLVDEMDGQSALAALTSALKTRYALTVKSNITTSGLVTKSQSLPQGAPVTLRVVPGSGEKFQYWADAGCNKVSADSIYYGIRMGACATTYTAMFVGGSSCTPVASACATPSSSSAASSSSVPVSSSSAVTAASSSSAVNAAFRSVIDMVTPDSGSGTTDTNHTGYTGAGFFNIANSDSSVAYYTFVSNQSSSNATLAIRYANGGTASRPMTFISDGYSYAVEFPATGSWDTWDTAYVTGVWVDAVEFPFVIKSTTAEGGPNIDFVAFDIGGVSRKPEGTEPLKKSLPAVNGASLDFVTGRITLARGGYCTVRVFDALGHSVYAESADLSAGTHALNFRESSFRAGVYLVDVSVNGAPVLRKMQAFRGYSDK